MATMDLSTAAILGAAGLAGGTLSSMVGGAALITFPALLAAGLPPLTATASNMVALTPGNFIAALTDRTQLPKLDRAFVGLVIASLAGAAFGAALLLVTPARMFEILVPLLLGFATLMVAFGDRISQGVRARAMAKHGREPTVRITSVPILLPVSIYGGYFGAGVGVLLIAVLSIVTAGDYRAANVTKNLVTSLNSFVASALFVVQGIVNWPAALLMMGGALVGALIGAQIARHAPRDIMRVVVIIVGCLLTVVYAWRYWF
jgi:uncharacterized membrane protein YfcA